MCLIQIVLYQHVEIMEFFAKIVERRLDALSVRMSVKTRIIAIAPCLLKAARELDASGLLDFRTCFGNVQLDRQV